MIHRYPLSLGGEGEGEGRLMIFTVRVWYSL